MSFIIGLTGSIGTGKSEVVRFWRRQGIPIYSADETVASLYSGAIDAPDVQSALEKLFPGSLTPTGAVNRSVLQKALSENGSLFSELEAIVHPFVRTMEDCFRCSPTVKHTGIGACEIPLLFETHGEERFDAIVVTTTTPDLQRKWVLDRPGMTESRFYALKARQMDDALKRSRAHFIIDTSASYDATYAQSRDVLRALSGRILYRTQQKDEACVL
jgi:dephospho-CoA kinase